MALDIFETFKILLLLMIAVELGLIIYDLKDKLEKEIKEDVLKELDSMRTTRRDVYGAFKAPLGDSYRKNIKGQYVPIRPNSKMIDGDDEEDDV